MPGRAEFGGTARGWLLGGAIVVLAAGAGVLTALAFAHVSKTPSDETVAPVPTFSQPPSTSPTPTPAPVAIHDRSLERFLAVGADALWRGTAGACDGAVPTLERSTDDGETWADVAPTSLGMVQLSGLAPFAGSEAEIIAGMGDDCGVQVLRTFTQGDFWAPSPEGPESAAYANAAGVMLRGESIDAPCDDIRSLRSSAATVAAVCAGTAYVLDESEWTALSPQDVVAVALDGGDVWIAHLSETCTGLALTRVAPDESTADAGCAAVADATAPAALAIGEDHAVLWAGNDWVSIPR